MKFELETIPGLGSGSVLFCFVLFFLLNSSCRLSVDHYLEILKLQMSFSKNKQKHFAPKFSPSRVYPQI